MKKDVYRVERTEDENFKGYVFTGYINDIPAGYSVGYERGSDSIDIQHSSLEKQFRGTKAVRAFGEIIKGIHEHYKIITCRIRNDLNGSIKIVLDTGFNIVGTNHDGNDIYVELIKIREDK